MQKIITTLFISSLVAGSASAAMVLNSDFESSATTGWDVQQTEAAGNSSGLHSAAGLDTYLSGDFSDLGSNRLILNSTSTRNFTYTAFVFEDDGTTNQLATDITWTFTAALGQRTNSGGASYDDTGSIDLRIGYLATDNDISTFTLLDEANYSAATIAAIGKGNYQDFSVSTTIAGSDIAFGKQLGIQFYAFSPGGGFGGQTLLQSSIDNIRVVPEPSTYAMLAGLLALGHVMVRRRRR